MLHKVIAALGNVGQQAQRTGMVDIAQVAAQFRVIYMHTPPAEMDPTFVGPPRTSLCDMVCGCITQAFLAPKAPDTKPLIKVNAEI